MTTAQAQTKFHIFTDCVDRDDEGNDQVSIYKTIVLGDVNATDDELICLAEQQNDWNVVAYGEGDESKVGHYTIERN